MPPAVPQVKAGKLFAIAVTSAKRSPLLPAGAPPAIVERFNADINRALEAADVKERFAQAGLEIVRYTSAEFGVFLKAEVPKWAAVVKSSGAKVE